MKSDHNFGPAVQIAVAIVVLIGMIGGTLIVAHSGYETTPKLGGTSVFVPAPEAYFLSATMFAMSVIGMVAIIWARRQSVAVTVLFTLLYVAVAVLVTYYLRSN